MDNKKFSRWLKNCLKNIRNYVINNYKIYAIISYILSVVFFLYLKFVRLTSKLEFEFPDNFSLVDKKPSIFCFWHGRLLSAIFARNLVSNATVLLSKGKDGDLVAVLMRLFKVGTVRGSTSRDNIDKGGATSLKLMINLLSVKKEFIAIAPDGPIGPRMRVTPGVALLSLLTKTPIVPITMSSKRRIIFNSWDRFMLPLPFNKIVVKVSDPILPINNKVKKYRLEDYRQKIEDIMIKQTQDLDKGMRQPLINPSKVDKKNNPLKRKIK